MNINENVNEVQKAYLVGIDLEGDGVAEISMQELVELVKTAGGEVFDCTIQKRNSVDPKICIGSGKLLEIKQIMQENHIELAIFDIELAPSQINNISEILEATVIDRTILILDIFAQRARTSEGKLQVELAQLKHRYNRLKGKGASLSRLGGGIGTRGPGETKLETDKRHIKRRIDKIEEDLEQVKSRRNEIRKSRAKKEFKTVSIVGYTNAGKSTLVNALTNSDIYAKDQLFATLDPTARKLELNDGNEVILVDTVGFIRNLPHFLVNAFMSTLEEVVLSDLVLLVCDISDPNSLDQQKITLDILDELKYTGKIIKVYNKLDEAKDLSASLDGVCISAKYNIGLKELKDKIEKELFDEKKIILLKIPYSDGAVVAKLKAKKQVLEEKFYEQYEIVKITIDNSDIYMYNQYITNNYS